MSNANQTSTFVRIEDKFLVPRASVAELTAVIAMRLRRADVAEVGFTVVESIYLDTQSLDLLRDHLAGRDVCSKLRARRYAPGGVPVGDAFLEVKSKRCGVSKKERIAIAAVVFDALASGAPLDVGMPALPPFVADLTARGTLWPRVLVRARRRAFEGDAMRVTIDGDLTFDAVTPIPRSLAGALRREAPSACGDRCDPRQDGIFEIKRPLAGSSPAWLHEYAARLGSIRIHFSKYCHSMLRLADAAETPSAAWSAQ